MSGPDFAALLNKRADDIERPKPLPAGHYFATVLKHEFGSSKNKNTPYVRFGFKIASADSDVAPEALEGVKIEREMRTDFYLTNDALFRLKDFFEACGLTVAGRQMNELVPETTGCSVKLQITQRPDDKGNIYNDVKTVLKA